MTSDLAVQTTEGANAAPGIDPLMVDKSLGDTNRHMTSDQIAEGVSATADIGTMMIDKSSGDTDRRVTCH